MISQDQPAKDDLGAGQAFALGSFGLVAEAADSFLDLPFLGFEFFKGASPISAKKLDYILN